MNQLEVLIMGQGYLLGCPEGGEARLREAVERVDAAMCRIRDAGKTRARDRIAVLAALNLAFDLTDRHAAAVHPPTETTASAMPEPQSADDPRLAALLGRLDRALGETAPAL